jgi:hypothetical protein
MNEIIIVKAIFAPSMLFNCCSIRLNVLNTFKRKVKEVIIENYPPFPPQGGDGEGYRTAQTRLPLPLFPILPSTVLHRRWQENNVTCFRLPVQNMLQGGLISLPR